MNSERWERIQRLLEEAETRPETEQAGFLQAACGADEALRDEVASLLSVPAEDQQLPTSWLGALTGPDVARFAPGERVGGRYLVHALLGRGGMGEVYEATDEELSITVALKTLRLAGDSEANLQRLKLEGLLARAVWHPNVCRVYDLCRHGAVDGAVWVLTMERLYGTTLAELLGRGRLPLDRSLPLAGQMAAGLGAAHQAGVVHRDFKPGNVMLVERDGGEQAVVTDFGTARTALRDGLEDSENTSAAIHGTPAYMAPEQWRGEDVGPAADIYALGVVLFEMVTGRLPFAPGTSLEVARQQREGEPPSARSVVPDLDERWDAVIRRCMAREPRHRFGRAVEVAQALAGHLPVATQRESASARQTLPAEIDAFVGRQSEIDGIERSLANGAALVTLLGAGGMGKTRLAARYGWRTLGAWPGGVWFCDLTEAKTLNALASAVAFSLGVELRSGDPLAQLGHAIAGRGRCLVILDNFELVVEHAGTTVGRWLEHAPEARFLVTSRQRLDLLGEAVQAVEPLSIETGVELFATRARGLLPMFELAGAEADAAREIVRLVDGMPLAIELAAARTRVMIPTEIVGRMRMRFRLLTGGRDARHETLEGVIDGSWELLSPWERAAWAQCSTFEGGFTVPAAEAVLDLGVWPEAPWIVDILQSLVDKSLLRTWVPPAAPGCPLPEVRFGMYSSLQEYAGMKLREAVLEAATHERHGHWYARYGAIDAIDALDGHDGLVRRRELEPERDNLVATCKRAVNRRDAAVTVAAYRASWAVFQLRGPFDAVIELGHEVLRDSWLGPTEEAGVLNSLGHAARYCGAMEEGRARLEQALAGARAGADRCLEGRILANLGASLFSQSQFDEATACFEQALAIAREVGDRGGESRVLNSLSLTRHYQGRGEEAVATSEAALAVTRAAGDKGMEGIVLGNLGMIHHDRGRAGEARAHYEAALVVDREVGNRHSEGIALLNLGSLLLDQGEMDEARVHQEAALVIHREAGDRRSAGAALINLGALHAAGGRTAQAQAHFEEALVIQREWGNRRFEGIVLANLGKLHHERGEIAEARTRLEEALAIHREVDDARYEGATLTDLARLHLLEGRIEVGRDSVAAAEPLLRQVDAGLDLAQLLCVRAELEHGSGNLDGASATLAEAEALSHRLGAGPDSETGRILARARRIIGAAPRLAMPGV